MREEKVLLKDNGYIRFDGEIVGFLGWNKNTLVDISVDEDCQNKGIATEAVSQLVERLRSEGYDEITTTTVVSGAMETVLRRNGFEQVVVEEEIALQENFKDELDDIPTTETFKWIKRL